MTLKYIALINQEIMLSILMFYCHSVKLFMELLSNVWNPYLHATQIGNLQLAQGSISNRVILLWHEIQSLAKQSRALGSYKSLLSAGGYLVFRKAWTCPFFGMGQQDQVTSDPRTFVSDRLYPRQTSSQFTNSLPYGEGLNQNVNQ